MDDDTSPVQAPSPCPFCEREGKDVRAIEKDERGDWRCVECGRLA